MSASILQQASVPLGAADRCDRCGAQAYVRAELPNNFELLFCAHHWEEHGDKVRAIAIRVQNELEKLRN